MRKGQLIWNAMAHHGYWEAPEANPLFFISDADFDFAMKEES